MVRKSIELDHKCRNATASFQIRKESHVAPQSPLFQSRKHFAKPVVLTGNFFLLLISPFPLAAKNEADRQAEKREIKRRLTRKVGPGSTLCSPSGRAVGDGGGRGHVAGSLLWVRSRGYCVSVPSAL